MSVANFDFLGLFFFLGLVASYFKSDLKYHEAGVAFVSSFLLLSIGLKGGHSFSYIQDYGLFFKASSLGLFSTLLVPVVIFFLFRNKMGIANAAALAACYGSVSVVTFVAAQNYMETAQVSYSAYNTALLALMEIPAILVAVFLGLKRLNAREFQKSTELVKSILSSKSFVLLIGGFGIGMMMNERTWLSLKPLFVDSFKGILAIYLLDLGIKAQQRFKELSKSYFLYVLVAIVLPVIFSTSFIFLATQIGLGVGDATLLGVLVGSASYIAAPACVSMAIPSANPGIYVSLPLAATFTFNIFLGIPLYLNIATFFSSL